MSPDRGQEKAEMMEAATVSSRLITSVLFLAGIGWLADTLLGTWPWLTGIGTVAGGAMGFYLTVLHAKEAEKRGR
ncbi:MAG: AtpZ/AtpI family protein [Acidimicrobiia bacterium]